MSGDRRWTDGGLPLLTAAEKEGMREFWKIYEETYEEITAALLKDIERLPDLAAAMRSLTKEQMDEQERRSRALLRAALLDGDWEPLLKDQRAQGSTYALLGVRVHEWFDLITDFKSAIVPRIVQRHGGAPEALASTLLGLFRYIDIAMGVIAEEYLNTKEKHIAQQQAAIHELSTPVLQVRERLLLLPIIGVIDTQRARLLTEQLLQATRRARAKVVIIDITGVPAVDSKVANHLLQTVAAAKLMGARVIVTGLSAEVAQALVTLGVDLGGLHTVGDLQGGFEEANRILGQALVSTPAQPVAAVRA